MKLVWVALEARVVSLACWPLAQDNVAFGGSRVSALLLFLDQLSQFLADCTVGLRVVRVLDPFVEVQFEALGNHFVQGRCLHEIAAQLVRTP